MEVGDEEQYTKSVSIEAECHGSDAVLEWKSIDSDCNALTRPQEVCLLFSFLLLCKSDSS